MTNRAAQTTQQIVSRLDAFNGGTAVRVAGYSTAQLHQDWEQLITGISACGRQVVDMPITESSHRRGGLYGVMSTWVEQFCASHGDDDRVLRLFDYLTMALDMGAQSVPSAEREERVADAVIRLVEALVTSQPALLVLPDPGQLSAQDQSLLQTLLQHFLHDPLAEVDPVGVEPPALGFVWFGRWTPESGPTLQVVTAKEQGRNEVKRFLDEQRVVDRFWETTKGDPEHLEALFESLPQSVSHLWVRRIEDLSSDQRRLMQYLAVADVPLEMSFLDRLVEGSVVPVVRALCDAGLATRQMDGGEIQVEVANGKIRDELVTGLDDESRCGLHRRLALTALETGGQEGGFIARHALAAGDDELGLEYGRSAARRQLCRGRWEDAAGLLRRLRRVQAPEDSAKREILELSLRLFEARSQWPQALTVVEQLLALAGADRERARMERRRATCLAKVGDGDRAHDRLQAALGYLGEEQGTAEHVRIWLALADLAYQRGDHDEARGLAERAGLHLEEYDLDGADTVTLMFECRRLLGKTALFRGELEAARRAFEENAVEARRRGRRGYQSGAEVNLAVVAVQQRRYAEAERRLNEALDCAAIPGGAPRLNCWLNLGIVCQRRGDFGAALDHYRRALGEATRCGDEVAREVAVHNLATLYQDMGAFEAARQLVAQRSRDDVEKSGDERRSSRGFASPWGAMVEAQIKLEEGDPRRAIEALRTAESQLGDTPRLYRSEMRLRQVPANLVLDHVEAARAILDELDHDMGSNAQMKTLYDYFDARVSYREGRGPDESQWRCIIDSLDSLGLYRDAVSARLTLSQVLEDDATRGQEAARLLIECGVQELRRRGETVPERFREDYFSAPTHRRLLKRYRHLGGELRDPEKPVQRDEDNPCDEQSSPAHVEEPSEMARNADREDQVDRQSPAYQKWRQRYRAMIGEDTKILQVFRYIDRVAPTDTTVLLAGESGTGKELVAEAIHEQSRRCDKPFVKVNCAAFVEELLLSELFGHEKGAFTGAVSSRKGRFERAHGGTIFLDEIGDISPKTQVSLLRVLQEGTFEPVGGTDTRQVDARVVAATNRDLDAMVREGTFRLDLYYRLKGFLIEVPPLRRRRQDMPRLLHHFAQRFAAGATAPSFSEEAIQFLACYRWPGNIRELENFVRSVLLFAREDEPIGMHEIAQVREFFSDDDLDENLPPIDPVVDIAAVMGEESNAVTAIAGDTEGALADEVVADKRSLSELKKRLEIKCIKRALKQTEGNITQAARILQMKRPRLSQIVNGTPDLLALKQELVG